MLSHAAARRKGLGRSLQNRWTLSQGDIRSWEAQSQYGRILALGGVIAFLRSKDEVHKALKKIESWLLPDGKFYLEVFNLDFWQSRTAWREGKWQFWYDIKSHGKHWFNWIRTLASNASSEMTRYEKSFSCTLRSPYYWCWCETLNLSLQDWNSLLVQAGFRVINIFSSWDEHIKSHPSPASARHNMIGFACEKELPNNILISTGPFSV